MLEFRIDVRVKESVKARCSRHPKFDPSVDEKMNSEPGCSICADIRALEASRIALEKAARSFERRAYQWRATDKARSIKLASSKSEST
jgi:hypothetical protein